MKKTKRYQLKKVVIKYFETGLKYRFDHLTK